MIVWNKSLILLFVTKIVILNNNAESDQHKKFDLQKVKVDLIKNQTIKFDIRSFYSIYSSSFNFSSNNKNISLPGF